MRTLKQTLKFSNKIKRATTTENAFDVGVAMIVAFYKEGDIESAASWLMHTHHIIQAKKDCCCGNAEWLANVACVIGKPEVADHIGLYTHCNTYHDRQFVPGLDASGTMFIPEGRSRYILEDESNLHRYTEVLDKIMGEIFNRSRAVSRQICRGAETKDDSMKSFFIELEKNLMGV
jgi:hypothetical protein